VSADELKAVVEHHRSLCNEIKDGCDRPSSVAGKLLMHMLKFETLSDIMLSEL